jgi:hypothetical protein
VELEVKPAIAPEIRAAARAAHTHIACLGIDRFATKTPPEMADGHAYAILGYDAKEDTVHIWNPWGNNHKPNGPPGLANGYVTEDGHFHMPMRDLLRAVKGTVSYETNQAPNKDDRRNK